MLSFNVRCHDTVVPNFSTLTREHLMFPIDLRTHLVRTLPPVTYP